MQPQLQYIAGGTVLVISKEVDLCLLIKAYFLRKGCRVFIFRSLEDGLHSAAQLAPDVVCIYPTAEETDQLTVNGFVQQSPSIQMIFRNEEVIYKK